MARPVQLAPGSLALVLCSLEAQEEAEGAEEPGGRAVFRAFRRANARCFWNSRLARAASRLAFQGWLRRGVLLVHAPPASLQVLRDAWCRRALRPPRGFRILAVGECGAGKGERQARAAGPSPGLWGGNWRWRVWVWERRQWLEKDCLEMFLLAGTQELPPSTKHDWTCPGPTLGCLHSSTL